MLEVFRVFLTVSISEPLCSDSTEHDTERSCIRIVAVLRSQIFQFRPKFIFITVLRFGRNSAIIFIRCCHQFFFFFQSSVIGQFLLLPKSINDYTFRQPKSLPVWFQLFLLKTLFHLLPQKRKNSPN